MQSLESCIIKMNKVSALIRMIDDTFVDGRDWRNAVLKS